LVSATHPRHPRQLRLRGLSLGGMAMTFSRAAPAACGECSAPRSGRCWRSNMQPPRASRSLGRRSHISGRHYGPRGTDARSEHVSCFISRCSPPESLTVVASRQSRVGRGPRNCSIFLYVAGNAKTPCSYREDGRTTIHDQRGVLRYIY